VRGGGKRIREENKNTDLDILTKILYSINICKFCYAYSAEADKTEVRIFQTTTPRFFNGKYHLKASTNNKINYIWWNNVLNSKSVVVNSTKYQ